MSEAKLKVKLLSATPDAERLIATAAKLCYSQSSIDEITDGLTDEIVDNFIEMLMDLKHESPIEHVTFTFGIEGVSRVLTHQLVRHRIASYSQQSQRYVHLGQFEYVVPPAIAADPLAKAIFIEKMESDQIAYDKLVRILMDNYSKEWLNNNGHTFDAEAFESFADMMLSLDKKQHGVFMKKAIEDARFVFPNACETKIIATMNARSWFNFLAHRCCNRAQWEIRELAKQILVILREQAPTLFKKVGPPCLNGPCPEGKMTCGKIAEVREMFGVEA